jgi:hypothetical protein
MSLDASEQAFLDKTLLGTQRSVQRCVRSSLDSSQLEVARKGATATLL